jgi:hypothetical protein
MVHWTVLSENRTTVYGCCEGEVLRRKGVPGASSTAFGLYSKLERWGWV